MNEQQDGEQRWANACNQQGWTEESQIIHLEGFLREKGLFNEFASYAEKAAAEEGGADLDAADAAITNAAFQVTEDDIEQVLHEYSLRVTNTNGKSFASMAGDLIWQIDAGRVERVALKAGVELDVQTAAALEEIKLILVEHGVLDF